MQEFPIYTLREANDALHEVIFITDAAIERLRAIEKPWSQLPFKKFDAMRGVAEEDLIRAEWAQRIAALGIMPKGFFVVDFQSPDPDTVFCWSYGEDCVQHQHQIWEGFAVRRRIGNTSQSTQPAERDDS